MASTNWLSGAASGAAVGATAGGPWGALIGGGVGLVSGIIADIANSSDENERSSKIQKYAKEYQIDAQELADAAKQAHEENYADYKQALGSVNWDEAGKVDFNKDDYDVDNYYASNRAQLVGNAARAAQGSAALAGMGRSSQAAMGIANAVADKNEELYKDAYNQMNSERTFDYNLAKDEASNRLSALKSKLSAQKELADIEDEGDQNYYQNQQGILGTGLSTKLAALQG